MACSTERHFTHGGRREGAGRPSDPRSDVPLYVGVSRQIHTFLKDQASIKHHTLAEEVRQRLEASVVEGDDGR